MARMPADGASCQHRPRSAQEKGLVPHSLLRQVPPGLQCRRSHQDAVPVAGITAGVGRAGDRVL